MCIVRGNVKTMNKLNISKVNVNKEILSNPFCEILNIILGSKYYGFLNLDLVVTSKKVIL